MVPKKIFIITCLLMYFFIANSYHAKSAEISKAKIPSMIGITTLGIGSAAHAMATTLSEVLKDKEKITVRVFPVEAEKPRINLLRTGEAHFTIIAGSSLYPMQLGIEDYATYDWGVQPLQMAWLGPAYLGLMTTKAHKEINKIEDIKGKKYAVLPHKTSVIMAQAFLAYAGLKWEDVIKVPVPGYTTQFKALMAGQVDVVPIANPATAILYEVESSPKGLKWISLPHSNTEGWRRLRELAPYGVPAKIAIGPGLSPENPLEGYMHAYALVVYEDANPDLVYLFTKTIGENLTRLHNMSPTWKVYTMDLALSIEGFPHIYHQGAIRYFKEKGLWTQKHENWNQRQIEIQNKLKILWKSTLDQAKAEKWKAEELLKRWHEKQRTVTGYTVVD